MGLLASALRGSEFMDRNPLSDYWYYPRSEPSYSGVSVSADTALSSSPVWAAVQLLSNSIAMAPIILYRRLSDGGKERAPDHPLYDLLHDSPNPWQTAYQWKSMMMVHALLWGNGYSQIKPGPRGPVDMLIPLHPDGVRVETLADGQGIRYQLRQKNGTWQPVNDEDIFHLPGLSMDGISGLFIMRYARESIGLELAAKRHAALSFGRGTRLSGILKIKGSLSKEAKDRLVESWAEGKGGGENAYKVAALDDNVDWIQTGMNNEDAQLLEQLNWSVEDVARFINVPLHMIQHTTPATSWGTGIESIKNGYVTFSVMPWTVKWEQVIHKDLILAKRAYFAEFLLDILLRGDTLARYQAYQIALGGNNSPGWMSQEEVRSKENMNPQPEQGTLNPGPQPGATGAPPPTGTSARDNLSLRLMVREAAARVARMETAAMEKADRKAREDPDSWSNAVKAFYSDHKGRLSSVLGLTAADADHYCRMQVDSLLVLDQFGGWLENESYRIDDLVTDALDGGWR